MTKDYVSYTRIIGALRRHEHLIDTSPTLERKAIMKKISAMEVGDVVRRSLTGARRRSSTKGSHERFTFTTRHRALSRVHLHLCREPRLEQAALRETGVLSSCRRLRGPLRLHGGAILRGGHPITNIYESLSFSCASAVSSYIRKAYHVEMVGIIASLVSLIVIMSLGFPRDIRPLIPAAKRLASRPLRPFIPGERDIRRPVSSYPFSTSS